MFRKLLYLVIFALLSQLLLGQDYTFYAISNDPGTDQSIYQCKLNGQLGIISAIEQYNGATRGDYLALSNDNRYLIATSKNTSLDKSGLIQFEVGEDGSLSFVKEVFKSNTDLPCHVSFTPDMQYVLSANYGDDEISLYYFGDNDLSPEINNIKKPDQSKGHFICTNPTGKFVHAVFLGLNRVYNYTLEENKFMPNPNQEYFNLPDGYGPRHLTFHPNSNFVYILNETHSSITACVYDSSKGVLTEFQNISMLPTGYSGNNNAAAIRIHPNGKYLYASNRGHNSIAVYSIGSNGELTFVEHETQSVNFPRDFNFSPDGKHLLVGNQKGNSIVSMNINENTGELSYTGFSMAMPSPVSIVFMSPQHDTSGSTALLVSNPIKPVSIYPNPSSGILHLQVPANLLIKEIRVFDVKGQLLKIMDKDNLEIIDLSDLPGGSYLVSFYANSHIINQKVIIR